MFFDMLVYSYFVTFFFFFKQKTAYEMRISDWSSDVCSPDLLQFTQIPLTLGVGETLADLLRHRNRPRIGKAAIIKTGAGDAVADKVKIGRREPSRIQLLPERVEIALLHIGQDDILAVRDAHLIKRILLCQIGKIGRAHVELQSLMRISNAVFCMNK